MTYQFGGGWSVTNEGLFCDDALMLEGIEPEDIEAVTDDATEATELLANLVAQYDAPGQQGLRKAITAARAFETEHRVEE